MIKLTRRALLRSAALGGGAALLAGCQPKVVEKIVKETVPVQQTVVMKETAVVTVAPKAVIKLDQVDYQNYEPNNTLYNEIVEDFNAYHPEYKLTRMAQSDTAVVVARYAAGQQPDIDETVQRDVLGLLDSNAYLPIQPFVDADPTFPKDWLPKVWGRYTHKGKSYCIPTDGQATYFVLNQSLFEKANIPLPGEDWTMQDVLDIGNQLTTDKNGKHPADAGFDPKNVKCWGFWGYPWANLCSPFWLGYGAAVTDPTDHSKVTFNSDAMYQSMLWRCNTVLKPPKGPMMDPSGCDNEPAFFDTQVAIKNEGSWSLVTFETMSAKNGVKWVWRKFPGPKKDSERMTFMGDTAIFVPKTTEVRQKGAWTWLNFFWQPKQQAKWCLGTGFLPLTKGAAEYATYQAQTKDRPWWAQSAEYMGHADPDTWGWYGSANAKGAVEQLHCDIFAGKVTEANLKASMAEAETKIKKAIADATPKS